MLRSHSLTLSRTHSHTHKQAAKGSAPTSHTLHSRSLLSCSRTLALSLSRARALSHTQTSSQEVGKHQLHSPFSPSSLALFSRAPLSLSQQPAEWSAAISRPVLSRSHLWCCHTPTRSLYRACVLSRTKRTSQRVGTHLEQDLNSLIVASLRCIVQCLSKTIIEKSNVSVCARVRVRACVSACARGRM